LPVTVDISLASEAVLVVVGEERVGIRGTTRTAWHMYQEVRGFLGGHVMM
jgi:3-oxoacyl-ACP reductase-like protein